MRQPIAGVCQLQQKDEIAGELLRLRPYAKAGAETWYPSGRVNTRATHIQCCPRPTEVPASGIFAARGLEQSGRLTAFQPENPQPRVRRATCQRYVCSGSNRHV